MCLFKKLARSWDSGELREQSGIRSCRQALLDVEIVIDSLEDAVHVSTSRVHSGEAERVHQAAVGSCGKRGAVVLGGSLVDHALVDDVK